jgi:hypothetical protein
VTPAAPHHLPIFIAAPAQSDWLMTVMLVFLILVVLSVGVIHLRIHVLDEHVAAGILVPDRRVTGLVAGYGQIEAQVMKVGMIGEVACMAIPFAVIPMVVTELQEVIASGQIRPTVCRRAATALRTPIPATTMPFRIRTSAPDGPSSSMRSTPSGWCTPRFCGSRRCSCRSGRWC